MIESTAKFWDAIYTRNINKMIGICYRYTANRQLAEDVGENNFVSNGSINFLGKVYLLLIDDNPVKPDSTIKLLQKQYRLRQLNIREATRKHGEKGENGAVEISMIE